jgi:hypothetical protein
MAATFPEDRGEQFRPYFDVENSPCPSRRTVATAPFFGRRRFSDGSRKLPPNEL